MKKIFLIIAIVQLLSVNYLHAHVYNSNLKRYANEDIPVNIIPRPVSIEKHAGVFKLNANVKLNFSGAGSQDVAALFANAVSLSTGYILKLSSKNGRGINFIINSVANKTIGDEGYTLQITPSSVNINANKPAGLFYGMQTLMQLLPKEIVSHTKVDQSSWQMPCVNIIDYPRFGWRGLMLDVSRHFFPKEFVEKYIDQLAKYKMNTFHWHLADDQGWRIEIKSLPELTKVGAWRAPRVGMWGTLSPQYGGEKATYGGYYTQEDIKEVVKYAVDRFVTIVPEIDVPGHSLAAIAAYPELSCTRGNFRVNVGNKFYTLEDNALCAGNEYCYEFMDKVITEVAALFPGQYIHIGGDECYKGFWQDCPKCKKRMQDENLKTTEELQSYFIKRMEKIIQSKGKKMIGWDEILEGGLAPDATVMSWRGTAGGIKAAQMNHKVVMTPTNNCYLDLYQGDIAVEPPTYSKLLLSSCYNFEPVPNGVDPTMVLGGQGNLWTEWVPTTRHAEYMVWPRAFALAEVLWSPKEGKDWGNFITRVQAHLERYDIADINYARSMYDAGIQPVKNPKGGLNILLSTEIKGIDIYYTFDGTYPDKFSPKYTDSLSVPMNADVIRILTYQNGKPIGKMITVNIKDLQQRLGK